MINVIPRYSAPKRTNRDPALEKAPTRNKTEWIGLGVVTTINAQAIERIENT